jgi:hypothetical protein
MQGLLRTRSGGKHFWIEVAHVLERVLGLRRIAQEPFGDRVPRQEAFGASPYNYGAKAPGAGGVAREGSDWVIRERVALSSLPIALRSPIGSLDVFERHLPPKTVPHLIAASGEAQAEVVEDSIEEVSGFLEPLDRRPLWCK